MIKISNSNHIVMVDDNEGDIVLAQECCQLSRLKNPWKTFSNGADFLAYLQQVNAGQAPVPALVLLDINMRTMNGFEVLAKARRVLTAPEVLLFCMLSSSNDPKDRERAQQLGASGFVTKFDDVEQYIEFFSSLAPAATGT